MNPNDFGSKMKPWLDRGAAAVGEMQATRLKSARLRAMDAYREPVRWLGLVTVNAGTAQTLHFLLGVIPLGLLANRVSQRRLMAVAGALRALSLAGLLAVLLSGLCRSRGWRYWASSAPPARWASAWPRQPWCARRSACQPGRDPWSVPKTQGRQFKAAGAGRAAGGARADRPGRRPSGRPPWPPGSGWRWGQSQRGNGWNS